MTSPRYPAAGGAGLPRGPFKPPARSDSGALPHRAAKGKPKAPKPKGPAAEWVDPATLTPWALNPRQRPSAAQVRELAASIQALGWGAPILARRRDRRILAGHTRQLAALQLGLELVPVRFVDVTDEQAQAITLADNRLQERGRWDQDRLATVLASLPAAAQAWAGWRPDEVGKALKAGPPLEGAPAAPARNASPYTIRLDEAQRATFCTYLDEARRERPKLRAGELVAELVERVKLNP